MIDVPALKASLDIVDVIKGYIDLKKKGANYTACCPFHGEKTPSFSVSQTKQLYHCFGCGTSGDAIDFVSEYENVNFRDAAKILNGEDVPESKAVSMKADREREKSRLQTEYLKAILLTDNHNLFRDTVVIEQLEIAEKVVNTVSTKIRREVEQTGSYIKHKEFIKYYGLCKFNGWTETIQYIKCCKYISSEPKDKALILDAVNIILLSESFGGAMEYKSGWLKRYFSYYNSILNMDV